MRIFLIIFLLFPGFQATGQILEIKNGYAKFETDAETLGIESRFAGEGNGLNGTINLTDSSFSFTFRLNRLETGIKLRDIHMHEDYLETEEFPVAYFNGKIMQGKAPREFIARGLFDLHGVKKEQVIVGKIAEGKLTAFWNLRLTDFNIEVPEKFLIGKISDILRMTVDCTYQEIK